MNNKAKAGSMGGQMTYQRYGSEFMSAIARQGGGRPKSPTLSQQRQQSASQQIKQGGNKGGDIAGNNLTMLKKEWLQQAGRCLI